MFKCALRTAPVVALIFIVLAGPAFATEPTNLSLCKQELIAYVNSGEYDRQVAKVADDADRYLAARIRQGAQPGTKLAIVFDIDETMLNSVSHIIDGDFGYVPAVWNHWVTAGQIPAMIPIQKVYATARQAGIAIIIITGRKPSDQPGTERNLRRVGYDQWEKIIFRPPHSKETLTNADFKTAARHEVAAEGYTIIANIGDQASDLVNGYAEKTFKLPNPFYLAK